jgi:hypothetical protein
MSMQKLKLVGCERFNFGGELYEKGKVYMVGESKATILLRKVDDYDRPMFASYVKPLKSEKQVIAENAARIAIAAAAEAASDEEDAIIVVDDDVEVVEIVDPEAAVEVVIDKDDDPALDEEDPENPEEVDVDEDRDDGTAVEV